MVFIEIKKIIEAFRNIDNDLKGNNIEMLGLDVVEENLSVEDVINMYVLEYIPLWIGEDEYNENFEVYKTLEKSLDNVNRVALKEEDKVLRRIKEGMNEENHTINIEKLIYGGF